MTTPTIISKQIRSAIAGVNVALLCVVTAYDKTTQSVSLHIVQSFRRMDPATGKIVQYQAPDIPNAPVQFPGSGDFTITFPINVGDSGLAIFSDRSIDEWLSEGGSDSEPQSTRRHDLTDAVFHPGVRSFSDPIPSSGYKDGATVIRADEILLGSSAAFQAVALGPLVSAVLEQLAIMLDSWVPVLGDGGTALKAAWSLLRVAGWPSSVSATKTKAE